VVPLSAPVSRLPAGKGPVARVWEPSLTVIEVALATFQLRVTFEPGVTELELVVKLVMVGGWFEGGGSEELPPPHPEIIAVVRKSISTAEQSHGTRVEVTCCTLQESGFAPEVRVPAPAT
jgi:hypothetical protein